MPASPITFVRRALHWQHGATGPLAVLVVGGLVAAASLAGPAAAQRPLARSVPAAPPLAAAAAQVPPVDDALDALAGPRTPRVSRSKPRPPLHRWVRPFWGYLSSPFGPRWGSFHKGIDLAGPWGAPFVAATDGCITYAGPMSGYGEVMMIDDWDGTETVYGHMSSFIRTSGCVKAGEEIARIGMSGDATGPHLHFEVRVDGTPINPIPFLAKRGVEI